MWKVNINNKIENKTEGYTLDIGVSEQFQNINCARLVKANILLIFRILKFYTFHRRNAFCTILRKSPKSPSN